MYFENNRRAPQNRADADFLRRMLGGELNGNGCGCARSADRSYERPVDRSYERSYEQRSDERSCNRDRSCNRSPVDARRGGMMGECCEWTPGQARQEVPVRPESGCGCQSPCDMSCPTEIPAPALAMVYCPRQCWRKLFDPEDGLKHGTIFAELVLPFEAVPQRGGKEGCACRPM